MTGGPWLRIIDGIDARRQSNAQQDQGEQGIDTQSWIRGTVFVGVLLALVLAERLAPRRAEHGDSARLASNLSLVAVDTLLLRLLLPVAAYGVAIACEQRGIGLFHLLELPTAAAVLLSVIALDALIYWQHRLFHAFGPLWRLHRVHHTDPAIDVTTALRFHPLEILLSMAIKIAAVAALGAPALAVLLFDVLLNACAMFNHADWKLPARVDAPLRRLVVTPDMHRVHHSVDPAETHRNFGFCLSTWDRLFGSYTAHPAAGHRDMRIGQADNRGAREQWLDALLLQPFRHRGASIRSHNKNKLS